jgi:hypothetical protein
MLYAGYSIPGGKQRQVADMSLVDPALGCSDVAAVAHSLQHLNIYIYMG